MPCLDDSPRLFERNPKGEFSQRLCSSQHLPGAPVQRIDVNLLRGKLAACVPIHLASALTQAQVDPVARTIRRAGVSPRVNKGLQQQGAMAVDVLPVLNELTC